MGNYTHLRFKGEIKEKYRAIFEPVALLRKWERLSFIPEINEFINLPRSHQIAKGPSWDSPAKWFTEDEFGNEIATDGFDLNYNVETGEWSFQCSLKNYDGEIDKFFQILPIIAQSISHIEILEYWADYSKKFDLINGKIVIVDEKYISYALYPEDE